jgi:hypothetical protein
MYKEKKVRKRTPQQAVVDEFHDTYLAMRNTKEGQERLLDFAGILTELFDLMVITPDTFLTVGLSRDGSKVLSTFTENGLKRYAPAGDLDSLLKEFEIL